MMPELINSAIARRTFLTTAAASVVGSLVPAQAAAEPTQKANAEVTLRAQKLAWAGVRLQLAKATLFIDPLLDPDVWGPALKDPMVPVDVAEGDRFVLVTHRHPDHFDPLAIRRALGEKGILVCDPDVAPLASAAGFRVRVASHWEPVLLGDITVSAVPAADGYGDPQVSWVVAGGGKRIIHCGDTLWHGWWWRIGRQWGSFDAAFLPINGARFEWRQPISDVSAVMTPEQAIAAAVVLDARLVVPIHYGVNGAEGYRELPNCEALLLEEARRRNIDVEVTRPGEWLTWHARSSATR